MPLVAAPPWLWELSARSGKKRQLPMCSASRTVFVLSVMPSLGTTSSVLQAVTTPLADYYAAVGGGLKLIPRNAGLLELREDYDAIERGSPAPGGTKFHRPNGILQAVGRTPQSPLRPGIFQCARPWQQRASRCRSRKPNRNALDAMASDPAEVSVQAAEEHCHSPAISFRFLITLEGRSAAGGRCHCLK